MSFSIYFQKLPDRFGRSKTSHLPVLPGRDPSGSRKDDQIKKRSRHGPLVNRRGFLGMLVAISTALLPGGRKTEAGSGRSRAALLCRCHIAGFQFHQGPEAHPSLVVGQGLLLKREPENPYDDLAISVHTVSGSRIGYLPRRLNEIPSTLMDDGHSLTAVIAAVDRDAPPWETVEMAVNLC